MKTYDLYAFGTNPEIIVGWHKIESHDHETAIALAAEIVQHGQRPHELWHGEYLVMRWEPPR